jgi:F420 biosynthesis protein FbiB-like protein
MQNREDASAIFARRMIRRYTDQPISQDTLEQMLEAAVRAPSPHNRQPWRFAVVKGDARMRLARAMGDQLRLDLAADGVPAEAIERDAGRSYQRITSAPASILACLSLRDMDRYPDERRNAAERWMAGQAVAAASQNILLRATELGLGACWMCAPLFCGEAVSQALSLPEDWEPQALITLGYPADEGRERERMSLNDVVMWVV